MDLAALYDAWAPRLLGYMISITRDGHRAEDALQNLFLKLAAGDSEIREPVVYLFRAARNEALRVSKRRPEQPLGAKEFLASRDGATDPEILSALDALPPDQAEVVLLHVVEGLAFREVGAVLGIPQDTAASRYRYGIEKLRWTLKID